MTTSPPRQDTPSGAASGQAARTGAAGGFTGLAAPLVDRLAGRAAEADRRGELPAEDLADLRASGLLALLVPVRLGGLGGGFADWACLAQALTRGSAATALVLNMHMSVVGALTAVPDELASALGVPQEYFAVRDRVLAEVAAGSFIAVALSERGAGSRLSALATTYRRDGDGFRVVGRKAFCSGARHADAYFLAARAASPGPGGEPGAGGPPRVSHFLVPAGPGTVVEPAWDSLGMRGTGSHDLAVDVHVPADALVGGVEGIGLLAARAMPQWMVGSYAAVYAGVARAALDAATEYVRGRGLAGRDGGLAALPAVRARLGRADAAVAALEVVIAECARRVDAEPGTAETNRWVWRAKLLAGETAQAVAASVVEACGAAVTRRGHPLERLYRDARCGALQPATSDVCADWLGLAALGADPDLDAQVPRW
ncbi:acyl-CoA/acyl-ACP dehydrogenase [Frankia sp. CN6]|uniref:Acyl-CoA/acyl-ACP dehydrogenase n=1 Tax=Frankia nepalensis TaxID=1836974 RepID=A0A937RCR3_9ACTN|nr:acyl-CoA dehydrogenase family protein [Frankia nepalensis]MBL7629718.1 acyl-CoA/acyl-ACP dehydrogenase [Frankia nepalensis]